MEITGRLQYTMLVCVVSIKEITVYYVSLSGLHQGDYSILC
ncbi:hypothetical protein RRG08_043786 [Elysia crispata]|uniref:Uncharacterized protein n=1 Tax=Elysia crispata TaxID=231223 RepID=A0AAE0Z4N7_9GAST|nr:hypothetical protein RRG08_043786 [Elysia crispata]